MMLIQTLHDIKRLLRRESIPLIGISLKFRQIIETRRRLLLCLLLHIRNDQFLPLNALFYLINNFLLK